MTKPAITKRSVKGAALTYAELDTNFQNLSDATVTLTAGSGGTSVTADLNGTITLVAGTGISLSGDNTAKTLTITGTSAGLTEIVEDTTPQLGGNLDVQSRTIYSSVNAYVRLNENYVYIGNTTSNLATGSNLIDLILRTGESTDSSSSITIRSEYDQDNHIELTTISNDTGKFGLVKTNAGVRVGTLTTTARDNQITAENGLIIYNTSTNKFQGYANGTWVDLH